MLLSKLIDSGLTPKLDVLNNILKNVKDIRSRLIQSTKSGKNIRSRLRLKGQGWWKNADARHEEVCQDISALMATNLLRSDAIKIVSKRNGLTFQNIKKILQRKKIKTLIQ